MTRAFDVAIGLACVLASACAGEPVPSPRPIPSPPPPTVAPARASAVHVSVKDLSPRFLAFYAAASRPDVSPDGRWELWRSMYAFAAVPPGPAGDTMARKLLDHAWPEYAGALERIRTQPPIIARLAEGAADRIALLLAADRPLEVKLVLYVGALETNAYTVMLEDVPTVALPVEGPPEAVPTLAAHEMTHAIHLQLAHLPGGWERSVAQTVLTEGLAMRVVQELYPGRPDAAYTEATPGWLARASARRADILRGLRPLLATSDGATVGKVTFGEGTTGLEREAYYAGWLVIERLRAQGMSYPQIARVPEKELVSVVGRAIDGLLGPE